MLHLSEEEKKEQEEKELEETKEGGEEAFEDLLVKKLLEGVKLVVKDQEVRGDTEVIKAELIDIKKDFEPEVPAEEMGSIEEEIAKRIDGAVNTVNQLIDQSREDFKNSLKQQITTFRKQVEELGRDIARAFAEKLKLKYTERVLRKTYEDIIQKELKKRQEIIIRDVLESLKPFYSGIQSSLRELQKVLLEMRTLYSDWIEAYTSIIQEAMSESRIDYDKLMKEIREYKRKYDELQSRLQELNYELAQKESEIEELKNKLSEYEEAAKLGAVANVEEINKIKAELEEKRRIIEDLKKQNEKFVSVMQKIVSSILLGEVVDENSTPEKLEEITSNIKEKWENMQKELDELKEQLVEKEKEISKLKTLLEGYKDFERIREDYDKIRQDYAKLKGEYEAIKEQYELLKKENADLREQINRMSDELANRVSHDISKESLNELLKEKDEEIKRLQQQLMDLEKIKAENKSLKEVVALKDSEIQKLKERIKEFEETTKALSELRNELETYKEMFGITTEPAGEEVERKYTELFEQIKKDLEVMRREVFEKSVQMADVLSENKALKNQLELKEKEIQSLKRENENLLRELEENKTMLKQLRMENEDLERKVAELSRKLEEIKKVPEELKQVLEATTIGKIYLILRDLKKVDMDRLASAIGMPKIQLQRELLKLAKVGLIKVENNTVYYTASE